MSYPAPDPARPAQVHVFAGPTIPAAEVRALLPHATVHPPVAHGAVLRLPVRAGDTVVIIDGLFYQAAAVRHKELLHLLGRGVAVIGASSMGALRAAELAPYGMLGYGRVYRLYRSGALVRDDEVAVAHAPAEEGFRPLTDALVSVRFAARRARRRGGLTAEEERLLVETAAALPFTARRHRTVAAAARRRGLRPQAAGAYLAAAAADVKYQDAAGLLRRLAAGGRRGAGTAPAPPAPTAWLVDWLHEAAGAAVDGIMVSDADALAWCALFAGDYPAFRHRLLLEALAEEAGAAGARGLPGDALEPLAVEAARARGLLPGYPERLPANLLAWLTPAERAGPLQRAVAVALTRSFRWVPGVPPRALLLDALRATGALAHARRAVAAAWRLNEELAGRNSRYTPEHVPDRLLRDWFARRWQADAGSFRLALFDRGFASEAEFRRRARRFLPYAVLRGVAPFLVRRPPAA